MTAGRSRALWSFAVLVLLGCLSGCKSRALPTKDATTRSSYILGGNSFDATASQALTARGVGWIQSATGVCTASPILRDVVLTAAHCICPVGGNGPGVSTPAPGCDPNRLSGDCPIIFHLPHPDPATGAIIDVPMGGKGIQASNAFCVSGNQVDGDPNAINEPSNSDADVAIVQLTTALTATDLPDVLDVYTLPDFINRVFNHPPKPGAPAFFGGTTEVVGFGDSIPNSPIRKQATVDRTLTFDIHTVFDTLNPLCHGPTSLVLCFDNARGYWIHDPLDTLEVPGRLLLQHGDSGGPITFLQDGSKRTIFGVGSIFHNDNIDTTPLIGGIAAFNSWSPTWDSGTFNGAFIRAFLHDADGDGVSDDIDNCTPPRCSSKETCFNPDQADADLDGVGDTCDNCAAFTCTRRGLDKSFCANHDQADLDKDGVGDVCDLCPAKTTSVLEKDKNGDGVGDSCDLCPATVGGGGRRACKTTSDCAGHGVCLTDDIRAGRCSVGGAACGVFIGLGCGSCVETGMWGACSEGMEPDTDGDGIGDRCDSCPIYADANLQQNSNAPAEAREGAAARNDACDSSPIFTARPVVEPNLGSTAGRTLFTVFAGVGSDNNAPAPPFGAAPVGFRHCDCATQDQVACLSACGTSRSDFDIPDSRWRIITVGAAPTGSYNEAQVTTPALDFRIDPLIYAGGIDCSDPLPHQTITIDLAHLTFVMPPDRNLCRLGAGTGRLLSWATNVDVAAGRVASMSALMPSLSGEPQQPQSVVQTRGFFWSHGTVPTSARAGNRDVAFNGRLRDNYTFVHTPSLSTDVINIPRILIRGSAPGCLQCFPVLSTDWIKPLIQPGSGINVLRLLPRPFIAYPDCVGAGTLCGIRRSTDPHIDLSLVFEPDARTAIVDATRFLVTPAESAPIDAARAGDIAAISVPRSWSQLGSVVQAIGASSSGKVGVLSAYQANSTTEAAIPFDGEGFVPSDREGARWLFSKLEQAVYMVGGTRQESPTSEIWRLDLQTATWKNLFAVSSSAPVHIRNVGALAYDAPSGRLLLVDDAPFAAPQNARLISFDTRAQTSRVVATLDLSNFVKTSLAVTGDTFVLVGATATNWTGYRFQITSQNTISWLGRTSGQGLVVADPLPWQEGPALFTQSGQSIDTIDLPPGAFTPAGTPPELKVCDQPLVVPAPAPVVITTCHQPALQPPTPTSACGPISFQSDAPRDFALGTRTVTWTLTDTFGNVARVPQTVTAVLGDDISCCPADTNVIVGTPNNDNLVGTSGSDCILGLGAQDTISGGGGDDFISGGDGDDVIDGGNGNDRISGGSGQDQITGGPGDDVIDGGDGDDTCHGGDGNDTIRGGDGQDHLFGENNDDRLFGEAGDDSLDGGPGNDLLNGGGLHDVCVGGTGTNTFVMCQTVQ